MGKCTGCSVGEAFNDPLDKAIFTPSAYPVVYWGYDTNIINVNAMGVITPPLNTGSTKVNVTVCGTHTFTVTVNISA